MKPKVMRPRLKRQIKADSIETANQRSMIFKRNLSGFFVHLYKSIYGGKILIDPWGNGFLTQAGDYNFRPDIERIEDGEIVFTEIKATSGRNLKIGLNVKQTSNNLCEFLVRSDEKGVRTMIDYGFFKYGQKNSVGFQKLNNSKLVKNLAESRNRLTIVPINLLLYLIYFASVEERNQTSSLFGRDSQKYHILNRNLLGPLENPEINLRDIGRGYKPKILEALCLGDIGVEHLISPPIKVNYIRESIVQPFPISSYFVPKEKHKKLIKSLRENREELVGNLGLIDIYGKLTGKVKHDLPF